VLQGERNLFYGCLVHDVLLQLAYALGHAQSPPRKRGTFSILAN
jgi:hypothetical protein